jgi:diaminohydroxyphosphoribosylaminopyrimidine deaminase/5-amino-6-(5-phosphoribosylamino)uracil reductase
MEQALQLARKGSGRVSPNPRVGCLLVNDNLVIGEGYHQRYGEAHAEVHALEMAGNKAKDATAYVTLEPCSTEFPGKKTPPCVGSLIRAGIKRAVIATRDPNPKVDGSGIYRLREAGIEVQEGVLAAEGYNLIRGFACWITSGKPYIILKGARTRDNFVAMTLQPGQWFTSSEARRSVHALRSEVDAILVGSRTAEQDNPKLTVREMTGRNPLRVILDTHRRLSPELNIFQDQAAPTLVFTAEGQSEATLWGEYVKVDRSANGVDLEQVLCVLGERGVTMLIIEGGPRVHESFMRANHMDEINLITTPTNSEKGVQARDDLRNVLTIPEGWDVIEERELDGDQMIVAQRGKGWYGSDGNVMSKTGST